VTADQGKLQLNMFFASRTRRGPDRYLRWKFAALVAGAVLILWGAQGERSWPVWAGVALLAAAFIMRFLPQPGRAAGADGDTTSEKEETG
jgi:hypothetical protein